MRSRRGQPINGVWSTMSVRTGGIRVSKEYIIAEHHISDARWVCKNIEDANLEYLEALHDELDAWISEVWSEIVKRKRKGE
jgi:hypothetical protein